MYSLSRTTQSSSKSPLHDILSHIHSPILVYKNVLRDTTTDSFCGRTFNKHSTKLTYTLCYPVFNVSILGPVPPLSTLPLDIPINIFTTTTIQWTTIQGQFVLDSKSTSSLWSLYCSSHSPRSTSFGICINPCKTTTHTPPSLVFLINIDSPSSQPHFSSSLPNSIQSSTSSSPSQIFPPEYWDIGHMSSQHHHNHRSPILTG